MEQGKLTTAVLGLSGRGLLLTQAALRTGHFEIRAVADTDAGLLQKTSDELHCAAYDDYRQLVIQNQLDCLLVAADIHTCGEHIRTAMKKKFNVLKLAPPARDFEEAAELVKLADSEGVKFAVANHARYAPSFVAAHDVLQQGQLEHIYLIEAFCTIDDCDRPAWRSDPKLAGGGVLLHECYCLIDQILWNFPVPQQVYSLATNQTPDKQQRLYLTEDTAIVSMRFSDSLIGNLTAVQREGAGPKQRSLRVYGKDKILSATSQRFSLSIAEQIIEESACDDDQFTTLAKVLDNFGLSLLTPEQCVLTSTARENLKNMALIKSAYLSAMTGFPEEPLRILNMAPAQPQVLNIS